MTADLHLIAKGLERGMNGWFSALCTQQEVGARYDPRPAEAQRG